MGTLSALLATAVVASPVPSPPPAEVVKPINQLLVRGKYAQGLREALALAARAEREGQVSLQARSLLVASDALYYLNRQPETRPYMERALALYESIGDQEGIGRAYYSLSFLYERTDPQRMIRLLETARPYAERSGDKKLQMFVHNGLGNAKFALSRATEALGHYRESVRVARELKEDHSLAVALSNVGLMEEHRARYAEAEAALEEARALHDKFGPSIQAGQVLVNLGLIRRSRGEPEAAMELYERGLAIYEQFGYRRYLSGPMTSVAELHEELGDPEQAVAMRRRALRIAQDADDTIHSVALLCLLARDADVQGRAREADELLDDAARRAAAHGDPGLRRDVALTRSRLALRRGDGRAALVSAEEAARLAPGGEDPQAEGLADHQRAEALSALGRPAEAAAAWQRAIARYEGTATSRHLHVWHGRLARVEAGLGHDERARFHYEESLRRTEDLDRALAVDRFRLSLFDEVADVHREYACWLAARGEGERAWQVLEQGRTRELRLRLARGGRPTELTAEEREAMARLSLLQRRLREEPLERDERRTLARTVAQAEDEYEQARRRAQRGRASARGDNLPPLEFPGDVTVVEYALTAERLLVLSRRDGVTRARLADARGLADRVRALRAAAADAGRPFTADAEAHALGRLLLGPETEGQRAGRLVLVPDDVLHTLPFALLRTADGGYLADERVISIVPSLGAWYELRSRSSAPPRTIAVMANTRFVDGSGEAERPRLAAAAREARDVAARARDPLLLLDATEAQLKREPLGEFQALHFATHVEIDETRPERSRIVLAAGENEDGFLQAREIERMSLPCLLAVVSGCRSGQGRIVAGEGVVGLSHAFYSAGARSLLMSLWDVSDESAALAMRLFYEALPGRSPAEALQIAQRGLRRSRRFDHPAYWAAFFVSGDADQRLDLGVRWPWWAHLSWLLPALVLGVVLLARRHPR